MSTELAECSQLNSFYSWQRDQDEEYEFDESDESLEKYVMCCFTSAERLKMQLTADSYDSLKERLFEYVVNNWDEFVTSHPEKVHQIVRQGIPDSLRPRMWRCLVDGVRERQQRYAGLYDKLKHSESGHETAIRRDTHRTFPDNPLFAEEDGEGQRGLFNVLNAYACFDHKVGYVQGMGFIVGFFLELMGEEDVFWILVSLMQETRSLYRLRYLFGPGVGGIHLMIYQIDRLTNMFLPKIADHLRYSGFETDVWVPPFIPTLFVGRLPRSAGSRVMDIFLCSGQTILMRLFLALLKILEEAILSQPPEQLLPNLKQLCDEFPTQQVLFVAFSFPVSPALLLELEQEYAKIKRETKSMSGVKK